MDRKLGGLTMKHGEIGVYIAIFGLLSLLAVYQFTSKGWIGGPIGRTGFYLALPAFVSLIWRIAIGIHWWTIAVFILGSLFVGYVNGKIYLRQRTSDDEHNTILGLQPMQTIIFLSAAVLSWFM